MWRSVGFSLIGSLLIVSMSPIAARGEDAAAPTSEWSASGGLYGWFPWVQGFATARSEDFTVYATPIDLIENFAAVPIMANLEVTNGKFSFWGDAINARFAFGSGFAGEANPIPGLQVGATGGSEADYNLGVYQFGGFYQVADFVGDYGNTTVEVGAGARFIQQEFRLKARIDATAQVRLRNLSNAIERRIQRISNREQRLEALSALNELRQESLEQKIIRAEDKGRDRRVAQLERRLRRVDDRGEALAALEALERLELELLRVALRLDGNDFNEQFAFLETGTMDWVDPTIAVRFHHHLGDGHSFTVTGDFGGFNIDNGLSSQMQLTYNVDGTLWGFQTTSTIGYRALWLNYEEETSKGTGGMNVWLHGPLAELLLRW